MVGTTVDSLNAVLDTLPPALATGPLAAAAMRLAEGLDDRNSLTSKAQAAKSFQDLLAELRELAPAKKENDPIDELSIERGKRRSGRRRRDTAA